MSARLGFAHRGARAHAPENTIAAFRLALRMGSPGIETDVWLTRDGVPVLHHGGTLRRRPIATLPAADLPPWLPHLSHLYDACGTELDLSVDLKDGRSADAVLAVARTAGHDLRRLWLCGGATSAVSWRRLNDDVRLVAPGPRDVTAAAWSGHLQRLQDGGVDAVNLRRRRWSPALVDSAHDRGMLAFGWDAQSTRRIRALLALGCDAVYSDHVDRMVAALNSL